ncbi:MAG: glutamate--tRNA ligase family protein, partial [Pseudomonadota bacterium]
MTTVTRFAPSPTGYLHLGNARQAVVNWLAARHGDGRFMLRIDDTDRARGEARFEAAILEDLTWLGLAWDQTARQSERSGAYEAAFTKLQGAGRVYPCFETAEELEERRQARLRRGLPPIYDGAAKRLTAEARRAFEAEGRVPHWRFAFDADEIVFGDRVAGSKRFQRKNLGDPVVRRADGSWMYLFASAVDDIELGVTCVIRGQDHLSNTPLQVELTQALGRAVPDFAHLPLILDAGGEKFSKRLGSL